jgi:hypothetical protein
VEATAARQRARLDRGLALVLVGDVDRRILPALMLAARLPELEPQALHVAIDSEQSRQAAQAWMELDLAWMPLHVEEPTSETFLACVQRVVGREAARRSRVLVIVPELDLDRWWQTLLHRSTGRRIARRLSRDHRVSTIVLPYPR